MISKGFREKIMVLEHDSNGHLGANKMLPMVGRHFIWPCMQNETWALYTGYVVCQWKLKHRSRRAPVLESPVLTERFKDVAVDIIGPFNHFELLHIKGD